MPIAKNSAKNWKRLVVYGLVALAALTAARLGISAFDASARQSLEQISAFKFDGQQAVERLDRRNSAFLYWLNKNDPVMYGRIKPLTDESRTIGASIMKKIGSPNPDADTRRAFDRFVSLQCQIEQIVGPNLMKQPAAVSAAFTNQRFNHAAVQVMRNAPVLQFVCKG